MRKLKTIKQAGGVEVLVGGEKDRRNGQTPTQFWENDFGPIVDNNIDRILNMPPIDDMAGVLARSNFHSEEERIAYLITIRKLEKFNLKSRLEFIRECASSTLGHLAFGKTLQLQHSTQLIAPAVIREQLSMKKVKEEEKIQKSDFRQETENTEPRRE